MFKKIVFNDFQIIGRNQTIRVEYNKIVSFRMFKTEIASKPLAAVLFNEVFYVELSIIRGNNILRIVYRAIFNNQNLELQIGLLC